jgi:hypothetical protein
LLLKISRDALLWLRLCRGTAVVRTFCVTAIAGLNDVFATLSNLSADRGIRATEEAPAGHPDRDADGQQQSQQFVRKQPHSA